MSRFTWAIVIGVLALIVASLGLAMSLRGREPTPDLTTPSGTTLAFALAIQSGDADRAWNLLAGTAQAQTTRERFVTRGANARSTYDRARLSVENERIEGDSASADLVRSYPSSGGPFAPSSSGRQQSSVRMVREQGAWRIATPPDPYLFLLDR